MRTSRLDIGGTGCTGCTGWDIERTAGVRWAGVDDREGARDMEGSGGRRAGITGAVDGEEGIDEFVVKVKFGWRGRALQSFLTWV